jgi:hypothetical protein
MRRRPKPLPWRGVISATSNAGGSWCRSGGGPHDRGCGRADHRSSAAGIRRHRAASATRFCQRTAPQLGIGDVG